MFTILGVEIYYEIKRINSIYSKKYLDTLGQKLIDAVFMHDPKQVDRFIKYGANINYQSENGITALYIASFSHMGKNKDDFYILKRLVESGIDPNVDTKEILKNLLEFKAYIDGPRMNGDKYIKENAIAKDNYLKNNPNKTEYIEQQMLATSIKYDEEYKLYSEAGELLDSVIKDFVQVLGESSETGNEVC